MYDSTVAGSLAMPGIISTTHRSTEEKEEQKNVFHRVRISLSRDPSNLTDEEVMYHPEMMRLMRFLESLPAEERILEFSVRSPEEEREYQAESRHQEVEETRNRVHETEEDRKDYMNRFFR